MSTSLIQVTIALTFLDSENTPSGVAYANTSVVVTDSTGVAQPAVLLTPANPSFTASVAVGAGTVVATDLDTAGTVLSTISQSFTEVGSPPAYTPVGTITVTPVGAPVATSALAHV